MKIHIAYNLKSGPWGGGNQFLKALQKGLITSGDYSEHLSKSDALIFNSYNDLWSMMKSNFLYPRKKIVYRLGPVFSTYRKGFKWKFIDKITVVFANLFSDLTVFQSRWSYEKAKEFGFSRNKKYTIILNAVDSTVFYKKPSKEKLHGEKIKLIYSSWSSNLKKGFAYLKFLDENLDFTKYEITFVGNSPFVFNNIKIIKPLTSVELSEKLRESDIFISPVEDDACSNALLEGLASGLPAVSLKSGGNPELIGLGGELFSNEKELLESIDKVAGNLNFYQNNISVKTIEEILKEYVEAIKNLC